MAKRRPPKPSMRVKDGRKQPFTWFPNALMRDYGADIGPHAGWVYMALVTHANKAADCWPAHDTLAAMTGMSIAQVKVSLNRLERLGLIAITMRRPKTNIYTVLDVPERPDNSQEVAIIPDTPNSQEVAINSQVVAINSQDMAIEQPGGSYEVDVSEVEPPNKNHSSSSSPTPPSPTPSAPIPTDEEVEEEQRRFQQFWEAYPRHIDKPLARRAFGNAHIDDATLATILAALQVQIPQWRRNGMRVGIKPAEYLENEVWLDHKPDGAARWTPTDETPTCQEPDCPETPGALSDRRCDVHAMTRMREEAACLLELLRQYSYEGERHWHIAREIRENHVDGSADEVQTFVLMAWEDKGDELTVDVLATNYIAAAVRSHRTRGGRTPELVL
jgi:hypothetical protein